MSFSPLQRFYIQPSTPLPNQEQELPARLLTRESLGELIRKSDHHSCSNSAEAEASFIFLQPLKSRAEWGFKPNPKGLL